MWLCCDLLKIHYLCGDKDNNITPTVWLQTVVICSKFITFAVTKTTGTTWQTLAGRLWFAQNSLPLRWQRQLGAAVDSMALVVICSKFITFAVTKTTLAKNLTKIEWLWFAQNSLPLRWQRQLTLVGTDNYKSCDLLKIHYLCGDKDNEY